MNENLFNVKIVALNSTS